MIKKLLFLLATMGLIANITGCTSKKSQDDSEIVENADVDKIESEEAKATADATAATTNAAEDPSLQAALGEVTTLPPSTDVVPAPTLDNVSLDAAPTLDATAPATTETVASAPDISAAPTLDETSLNDVPPPIAEAAPTITETPIATDTSLSNSPPVVVENSAPPVVEEPPVVEKITNEAPVSTTAKTSGSGGLKKVSMTAPYQAATGWVNTVYVARPGEKLKDISMKIFNADKTKDLKKISENSYLKSRSVKAGDKVYYVSPNRPDDSSKTLLYYEDMGMVPETYVAKKGDKLKKVAKEILGYDKAWVEMWTSNSVESKNNLAEGDTLKYWRSASSINTMAQNTDVNPNSGGAAKLVDASQAPQVPTPPPADMNAQPPQQVAANTPPPADMNSLPPPDMAPPPPPSQAAMPGGSEMPPQANANLPPPPPPPDMAPPPPPDMAPPVEAAMPPQKAPKKKVVTNPEEESAIGGLDNDTMMSLGAVGLLTAALAFVLIRRKKKKAAELAAMNETGVG